MKKIITLFTLFIILLISQNLSFADISTIYKYDDSISDNIIKKTQKHIIKTTKGEYKLIYCEDCDFSRILQGLYNIYPNIIFKNYPLEGTIKHKTNKPAEIEMPITIENNLIKYKYGYKSKDINNKRLNFPYEEEPSFISKFLDIYFPQYYISSYAYLMEFSPFFDEEIKIDNNKIIVKLNEIFIPQLNKEQYSKYKFKINRKNYLLENILAANSADEIYNAINDCSNIEFTNYPQDFNIIIKDKGISSTIVEFKNGKKNREYIITNTPKLSDSNSFINKKLNDICQKKYYQVLITFFDIDYLSKNEEYNFGYKIKKQYKLGGQIKEDIIFPDNKTSKIQVKYISKTEGRNIFIIEKNDLIVTEDEKGNILIPNKNISIEDNIHTKIIKKIIKNPEIRENQFKLAYKIIKKSIENAVCIVIFPFWLLLFWIAMS